MNRFSQQQDQLGSLEATGRNRALMLPTGKEFSSNDYLGLARSPFLRNSATAALEKGIAHGSGGSRLLGGNHPEHQALETFAADHYGAESSLFFGSGYTANLAFFSAVPQNGDLVLHDELVHASVHDGMKLGRAFAQSFRHNDCQDLEDKIVEWRSAGGTGNIWIATESLFSMDGDRAPLVDLKTLANKYEAMLVIDEAHTVGVFGDRGVGLTGDCKIQHNLIVLRTCGKALGVEGAILTMPALLRDFMINRARAFIFSTAPSPLTAHLVDQAIRHVANTPGLQSELAGHIAMAKQCLGGLYPADSGNSQIFPILLGEDRLAVSIAQSLQSQGYDVRAIRPPTVPAGTARLRIALSLNVSREDIGNLGDALRQSMEQAKAA